ncbi:MAG TPA: hypothetical protein D7I08_01490 [Candidatus Poseidoniales archaeon]|nr:hypothetical protein [Candidatus Thermoplasmatota archaeon]DAC59897.1 MAG TPA: hypothetical protein D7I08_01490 [Candidatus Poseidoniales archaeon]|tara:strand:+ start:749 stop:4177 length:3429 start_codon:yes stop_codon:yes gene_type:complete
MAKSAETRSHRKHGAVLMVFLFLASVTSLAVQAADSDGDGVQDSADDCPWAAGTSTVDKTGCPDRDGDGTSDFSDPWAITNPNYQNEFTTSSSNDYYAVDYSPSGEFIVTGSEDGFVRIWNASTWTNLRSANTNTDVNSVDYSADGMYVAAGLNDDTINIYYSSNLTSVHGAISVDVGSNDQVNSVEFSPDSSTVAVAIGRDNANQGTNGEVTVYDVLTGTELYAINPNGEDLFYDLAHSPDGQYIALAGYSDIYIVNTTSRSTTWTFTNPPAAVNSLAWSPDGNFISMCGGWEGQSASFDMYQYGSGSWNRIWQKTTTTSCASTTFSSDSSQVISGMYWYQADGATARVYDSYSGTQIDSFNGPRPGGCTSGNNNQCGVIYGVAWSPDSTHIVTAHGRNDEGVYYWFADIDEDNDGYNTTDQGDGVVDAFPSDGTQWDDTDDDGYGDNPAPANEPDACPTTPGTSTEDRYGCPDADGDGWSDEGDWAVLDPSQWVDADEDGYGDNYLFDLDEYQYHVNQSGDAFPNDPTQWNDTDGDGFGDNYANESWNTYRPPEWPGLLLPAANQPDVFPLDRTQHMDSDGDWVGDNPNSDRADACPNAWGDSQYDRLGCPDTDSDGYSDPTAGWPSTSDCFGADAFPDDPTQWCDEDNDGFGSNPDGNQPDECPNNPGSSTVDRIGCADRDGDGYSNAGDPFPDDATQWSDRDGDNRGDNASGNNPDAFPDDTSQWKDSDGDGYGDNPGGFNGDAFPTDPTQWSDEDGDGYGDNSDGQNGDVCPLDYGESQAELSRGCPDSDLDGVTDPLDAFPSDPFQWADSDGDGFGDNTNVPSGDDCVDVFGKSFEEGRHGCPDQDLDGYADVDDLFPTDHEQWADFDGDGWGDNYFWENYTEVDSENREIFLVLREQRGDAFPEIASQWSDMDGDGWGDNQNSSNRVDNFPLRPTQWNDFDGDGYGDNAVAGSYQPDACPKVPGTSTANEEYGCPDSDNDGVSDDADPCPWDPDVSQGSRSTAACSITSDPSLQSNDGGGGSSLLSGESGTLQIMGGVIIFLLALIVVAQVSRAAGKRRAMANKREEQLSQASVAEEEERRQAWIQHYLAEGNYAEARALGWEGTEGLPEWKQYEMQQQAAQDAAIPTMMDLENL